MKCYSHYAAIVAILWAGDISVCVVGHSKAASIAVGLIEGSQILWSDAGGDVWRYSMVSVDGDVEGHTTDLPWTAKLEEVARLIATYDYESPVEFPVDNLTV